NVRNLNIALHQYATRSDGYIPLIHEGSVKQFNYTIGHAGNPTPHMGAPWGSPYAENLLQDTDGLFCPLMVDRPLATFNTKLFSWEQYTDDGISAYWFGDPNVATDPYMNIGYAVRPVVNRRRAYGSGRCAMPRMSDFPTGTAIVTDIVSTPYYAAGHHFPVITVGHLGGSVSRFDGEEFAAAWHALPEIDYDASDVMLTDDGQGGIYVQMDR
ncbi:MAG: hypothetical protein ACYS5V_11210, partial [Planctomycetota bacterium]